MSQPKETNLVEKQAAKLSHLIPAMRELRESLKTADISKSRDLRDIVDESAVKEFVKIAEEVIDLLKRHTSLRSGPQEKPQMPRAATEAEQPTAPNSRPEIKGGDIAQAKMPSSSSTSSLSKSPPIYFRMASNAKINARYEALILSEPKVKVLKVQPEVSKIELDSQNPRSLSLEDLGLKFDKETRSISGQPEQDGEFILSLLFENKEGEAKPHQGECRLIVNPEQKWEKKEPDVQLPYSKDHEDKKRDSIEHGMALVAASKRGRSHAHRAGFRDDDFRFINNSESGWQIIAVADGAGSAQYSRQGAKLAVEASVKALDSYLRPERLENLKRLLEDKDTKARDQYFQEAFKQAAQEAIRAIDSEAKSRSEVESRSISAKDYSTTLILIVHRLFVDLQDGGKHIIAAYQVGDGGAAIFREDQNGSEVIPLGMADSGEYAGQTRFLDQKMLQDGEVEHRTYIKEVPNFIAVIAMTDGITDAFFETDDDFKNNAKWVKFWGELAPKIKSSDPDEKLLDWLNFESIGNHDDRTIAVLYKSDGDTAQSD